MDCIRVKARWHAAPQRPRAAGFLHHARHRAQRDRGGAASRFRSSATSPAPVRALAKEQAWIPLGPLERLPDRSRRGLATYENPFAVPWDGETANIPCWVRRARRRQVPGLRDQLHAPRLPGALVPGIGPVHVPVPRRRLLRRRRARLGPAAARPLSVRVQDRRRPALGARRASCRRWRSRV